MSNLRLKKITSSIFVIVFILTAMIQCTKDGVNAPLIQRAIVDPDSTVFASFYDTVLIEKRDATPDVNDVIGSTGVLSIINSNCASVACSGMPWGGTQHCGFHCGNCLAARRVLD